jgi:hypothetical protein
VTTAGGIAAARAAVGIDAVLGAYDCAPVKSGRMACPVHQGRNPTCFSVRNNEHFRCFNCDAHGDVVELERLLGGGTVADALGRLRDRHGVNLARVDIKTVRRRRRRLARLDQWWRDRSYEWIHALIAADTAVREWQCDPADADSVFWIELDRRCHARNIAEAMVETFAELRTVEQRANAFAVEQRGLVYLPREVGCAA